MLKINKINKKYNNIRETIIIEKKKLKMLYLINALLRTKFFITKIVYIYLNRYTRLSFEKYIINLYIII